MGKLDLNLEGYRALTDSLQRLRHLVRTALEERYGTGWHQVALASPVGEHLQQRQEREVAISWRLPEGSDILDFAGFSDLFELAATDEATLACLSSLAPSPELLRARFLEVDVIHSRIAYGRPISDAELEFVLGFGERLRKVTNERSRLTPAVGEDAGTAAAAAAPPPPEKPAAPRPTQPVKAAAASSRQPAAPPVARGGDGSPQLSPTELSAALEQRDSPRLLAALYREITAIADRLWRSGASGEGWVWAAVRESSWYRENFSTLGMKVVSDFYALVEQCRQNSNLAEDPVAIQGFLKRSNFAQLLMALRDFFKAKLGRDPNLREGA